MNLLCSKAFLFLRAVLSQNITLLKIKRRIFFPIKMGISVLLYPVDESPCNEAWIPVLFNLLNVPYLLIGNDSAVDGERYDTVIANSKAAGAQPMITIPTINWIAKLEPNRSKLSSFSIAKYGKQLDNSDVKTNL